MRGVIGVACSRETKI